MSRPLSELGLTASQLRGLAKTMDELDVAGSDYDFTVNGTLEIGVEEGAILVAVSTENVATVVGYK